MKTDLSEMLSILACPVTKSSLTLQSDELVGEVGGLRYPIENGIPVLLPEKAKLPQGFASLEEFKTAFVK
ncbi:MAG: Trm112 family protein [Verrucomicrobiota bacterium]